MGARRVSRRDALLSIGGALLAPVLGRSADAFAVDNPVVTIYSSMPSAYMTRLADAFNAEKTGITLKIYTAATFQAVERLLAELRAGRVQADLFQVSDLSAFVTLKRQGALARYESETYKHYSPAFKDRDFTWINSRSLITLFAYNTNQILVSDAPKNWDDFASPKWAGKQGMADPRVDGDAYNWYYTLRKTKGVEWWKKFAKNKPQVFRGHGALIDKLISGELPLTEQLDYIVYTNVRDRKTPIHAVFPPEVVPVTMTPLAVLKQAPNPDGARKVFDWFLSKRGQELLQQLSGCYSARDDVDNLPHRPAFSSVKTLTIDPEDFTNSREKLQDEFADIFDL